MANWQNLSIEETIRRIKDEEIVLPVIQRRLIWSEDKMEILFDSLLKGNSFGAVICTEEQKDTEPLFAYRRFTQDGNDVASQKVDELSKIIWLIIDGQQRLQSFYIGLTGTMNGKSLYFDLFSDPNMEYGFKFARKKDDLPKTNNERTSGEACSECLWYSVNELFQRLSKSIKPRKISAEIIKKYKIEDENQEEIIHNNVDDFERAVFDKRCGIGFSVVDVAKDENLSENRQRIVELFRRLNDGGTRLSSYDLVASMFKGYDYEMEQFLDNVVRDYSEIGMDQDFLIKLVLILNDKPTKEMTDLTTEDAKFASDNSERIKATLKALKIFLKLNDNYDWFAGTKKRSYIPLYFLAYHIFWRDVPTEELEHIFDCYDTNDENYHNMSVWLRLSMLNKVFSRGCGWIPYRTGIRKIHAVMQKNKGKIFPKDDLFVEYRYHPLTFSSTVNKDNLNEFDQDYMFYIMYNKKCSIRSEDIDHIHPQSLLFNAGFGWGLVNHIANYQLLDSKTNRGIKNGKQLSHWINECVGSENKKDYLKTHLIPEDESLWETENFPQFLEARAQMIADKINSFIE